MKKPITVAALTDLGRQRLSQELAFFPTLWAFNISWHARPKRTIYSYAEPKGWFAP